LERADEEMQRAFEAKLAEQKERFLALNNLADGVQELRVEFKRAIEELVAAFGMQLRELEERVKAVPGKLPVAKTWRLESVTYEGEFVCHEGALWQACKDTAQAPGGLDWVCVARAGRDAITPNFRGGFNAYKKYRRLDVVEFDGSSFIALRDAPGTPGGDGWQVLSRSGRRGPVGESGSRGRKGERGERGEAAPTIINWTIDPVHYRAVPTMSDGTFGAPLDLRPLFEAYNIETS
jgi:hypothetical protein